MNESRMAAKVGAFVVVTIVVLAAILLVFSKGTSWFTPTYALRLHAESVGGLKTRSAVLVSGVPVGTVAAIQLSPEGKGVTILLKIIKDYRIHRDAQFVVEQIGMLGDQFVVINPTDNKAPLLEDGDEVECRPPFSLQELARSSVGFLQRVDEVTRMVRDAVTRINTLLLTEQTLTNLSHGIGNLRTASDKAVGFVDNLNGFLATNTTPVTASLTNFARLATELNRLSDDLRQTVTENRAGVSAVVRSLEESARAVSGLARDLEAGRGVAGSLFKDEELQATLSTTLANLSVAASNVANYGLLFKPKKPKPLPTSRK